MDEIVFEEEKEERETTDVAELIKKLREKLKKCLQEKQEYLAGWQRAKADFINARKEEEEGRQEFIKFAEANLIFELLALADSFDGLFKHGENNEGIKNIYQQLLSILKSRGVEPIECLNQDFNPEEHESVDEIVLDNKEKEGKIIEEIRKGYKMHGKVLRPAQVKIGVCQK